MLLTSTLNSTLKELAGLEMTKNPIVKGKLVCVALNDSEQFNAMQAEFAEAPYKALQRSRFSTLSRTTPGVLMVLWLSGLRVLIAWLSVHLLLLFW